MEATIRPARPADRDAIESIVDAAYRGYIARNGLVPGPMKDDYPALVAAGHVHVLEEAGDVVGLVVLIREGATMLLDNVAVRPDRTGQGLGRRLIAFAEGTAAAAGCTAVRLYTQEIMTENIALYGRLGYRETRRAVEHGLPRVFMRKELAAST